MTKSIQLLLCFCLSSILAVSAQDCSQTFLHPYLLGGTTGSTVILTLDNAGGFTAFGGYSSEADLVGTTV
jgi:hypothetical protein